MSPAVALCVDGSLLSISSPVAFPALVLAFDPITGAGAYLNCQVGVGTTTVPSPLGAGNHITYEVVDESGRVRGSFPG